jgi:hypothetical protein
LSNAHIPCGYARDFALIARKDAGFKRHINAPCDKTRYRYK